MKEELYKTYTPEEYPTYDNYDAIHITKVELIPIDYAGIMSVPITFLDKHNPEEFEIIGEFNNGSDNPFDLVKPKLDGKYVYKRIAIRNVSPEVVK